MIQVDLRSRVPIYEQLYENVRKMILEGTLVEDEKIPSVRELASLLTINPNTIQKAYKALEKDGYIYSVSGRGNFVNVLKPALMDQEQEVVYKTLIRTIEEAKLVGIPKERIMEGLIAIYKEENND